MNTLIEGIRNIIGVPQVYVDGVLDAGFFLEYLGAIIILSIVVGSIFKIIKGFFK